MILTAPKAVKGGEALAAQPESGRAGTEAGKDPEAWLRQLPVYLDEASSIPIYLQIKYQLRYYITSRRIPEGAKLPPVREAARLWRVTPGTVALAYKELQADGLIASHRGRGTYVLPFIPDQPDHPVREALLTDALETAIRRGFALGFQKDEIQHRFSGLLTQVPAVVPVAFVGPTPAVAEKYAGLLLHHLGGRVRPIPVVEAALETLERAEVHRLLQDVYYVVTFALQVKRIDQVLRELGGHWRVLGIATEVTATTLDALQQLRPGQRVGLLTQERYLHAALNLIRQHSRLGDAPIATGLETDDTETQRRVAAADVVLYTFGVRDLVEELGVPGARRLELEFDISPDSVLKLRRVLGAR